MRSAKILIYLFLMSLLIFFTIVEANTVKAAATFGNASASDLLSGKTVTVDAGQITGAMINKVGSGTVITPGSADQIIPQGYYGGEIGDGIVTGVVVPADKVLTGTTIAGTAGEMPNLAVSNPDGIGVGKSNALQYWTGGGSDVYLKPQAGYYDGIDTWTKYSEPNLVPSNIRSGVSILGVTGAMSSLEPGEVLISSNTASQKRSSGSDGAILKQTKITGGSGTVRVRFTISGNDMYSFNYARIYINGSPMGTTVGTSGSQTGTFTQDVAVNNGDLIQVYAGCSNTHSAYVYVSNLNIYVAQSIPAFTSNF